MYYLNDQHPKYQYAIYCRVGNAMPYIIEKWFKDLNDIYRYIAEIEKKHNRYNQAFYIDNDFYNNQYKNINCVYYKFLRRPVSDWEEFNTEEEYTNIFYLFQKTR